jgi:hypothetical protein
MVCQACGGPVAGAGTRCGVQVGPPPLGMPGQMFFASRVQRHLQTLGILWCVLGLYRLVSGLIGMVLLGSVSHGLGGYNWDFGQGLRFGPHWLGALVPVVAVYTAIVTALAFLVGFSLLTRKPWGRTLAIVVGILTLLRPVLGTALGGYTLWVLAPVASALEYDAIADRG